MGCIGRSLPLELRVSLFNERRCALGVVGTCHCLPQSLYLCLHGFTDGPTTTLFDEPFRRL